MQNLKTEGSADIDSGHPYATSLGELRSPHSRPLSRSVSSKIITALTFNLALHTSKLWCRRPQPLNKLTLLPLQPRSMASSSRTRTAQTRAYPQPTTLWNYKMLSPKLKEWLWQDHKKAKVNGEDIPAAKKRWGQTPPSRLNTLSLLWQL